MDLTILKNELQALGIPVPDDIPFEEWALQLRSNPTRNLATLIAVSTVAFYLLERRRNPEVQDIWDSLIYSATSLSVGYAKMHPVTPGGKILGSVIQTIGPAMAASALEPPRPPVAPAIGPPAAPDDGVQREILETLKRILDRLDTMAPKPDV